MLPAVAEGGVGGGKPDGRVASLTRVLCVKLWLLVPAGLLGLMYRRHLLPCLPTGCAMCLVCPQVFP